MKALALMLALRSGSRRLGAAVRFAPAAWHSFAVTALLLFALPSFGAGGKQLTLVFQGDNGGEVAPCG